MDERQTIRDFKAMCEKSINPDLYSSLVDDIIPALRLSRGELKPDGQCSDCKTKPSIGMYGETPKVQIGSLTICEMRIPPNESIWIEDGDEDGMEFKKKHFFPFLKEWYDKNF